MSKQKRLGDATEFLRDRILDAVRSETRDLSLRQFAVLLVCFTADEPQTIRGLAEFLSIPKPSVTRVADRLEVAELIRRRIDPADGRSVLLYISAAGKRYCKAFVASPTER
ncbi:MarR family transcriptional regulator [Acidisoma cellulosilytica]|uniref:MarR family transcriptional regulator n=1 Tax=Acidisoma cellulosilyticum TaxID=2802395 RepID=A0A963Z929_9PROT|nr:MarR family transcriptional regulator [Acidisoma cellulosilyticum]MCB8884112.1 MarR family transcriptional regulator [Acidisoma cellulosilyticum]